MRVRQHVKHATHLSCLFAYMTMRIVLMGLLLAWVIHVKPLYISYCEHVAETNNIWKYV